MSISLNFLLGHKLYFTLRSVLPLFLFTISFSRTTLYYIVATGYRWLLKFIFYELKLKKIKNSIPQSHQLHFKSSCFIVGGVADQHQGLARARQALCREATTPAHHFNFLMVTQAILTAEIQTSSFATITESSIKQSGPRSMK